jgi:hypothetical protein
MLLFARTVRGVMLLEGTVTAMVSFHVPGPAPPGLPRLHREQGKEASVAWQGPWRLVNKRRLFRLLQGILKRCFRSRPSVG